MDPETDIQDELLDDLSMPRSGPKPENPLKWVHRSLRGRYHWAVLLGLILMVPCSIVGFFVLPPTYQSAGLVQVTPNIQPLVYNTMEGAVPPMFGSYVSALGQLMKTRRVLDKTVDDNRMRQVEWPRGMAGVAALETGVSVGVGRGGQLISVTVEDRDPLRAQVAVNSLLDAFLSIHGEQFGIGVTERERLLTELVQKGHREIETIKSRISSIAQEFGTDELERLHTAELEKLRRLEDEITAYTIQMEAMQAQRPDGSGAAPSLENASIDQLALLDRDLASLVDHRRRSEKDLELIVTRLGPNHRSAKDIQRRIDADDRLIEDRVAVLRGQLTSDNPTAGIGGALNQLQGRLTQLKALRQITADEVRDIGNKKLAINRFKEEEQSKKTALAQIERQLDQLRIEIPQLQQGRVTIAQRGEFPSGPFNDRRKALAGAGAFGGFALGVGIVGLLGYMKRGYRYLDELADLSNAATLLGTLPDLNSPSAEENQLAALAIHHVRNMLHVLSPAQPGRGRLFAVTSASAGDGKTSLTFALGMSFAVAGQKTLVVDADLIGRGLTSQTDLVGKMGVAEATEASDLTRCIHATSTPNLCVMPAGAIPGFDPERLSEADLGRMGVKLRERFDTILVDTGPILGSLEADIVCARADRVIMTISRGQAPRVVQASLARLKHLGARSVGLVFNRATPQDMTKSVSHVSIHSESLRQLPTDSPERARRRITPLARALGGKLTPGQPVLNGAVADDELSEAPGAQTVKAGAKKDGDESTW